MNRNLPAGLLSATLCLLVHALHTAAQPLPIIYQLPGSTPLERFGRGLSCLNRFNSSVTTPQLAYGIPGGVNGGSLVVQDLTPPATVYYNNNPGGMMNEELGDKVAAIGDVDGDGFEDVAVSAIGAGKVFIVLSEAGETSYELFSSLASSPSDRFGGAIAGLYSDIEGGGFPDVIVGAPGYPGGSNTGYVGIFRGESGSPLVEAFGTNSGDSFGFAVASISDIGGSNLRDYLVGAPGGSANGQVFAYVGELNTPMLLWTLTGTAPGDGFGFSIANVDDVDGDSTEDFVVGAPNGNTGSILGTGYVQLFSGQTHTMLCEISGTDMNEHLGISVASAGDVNNDGNPDFAIGAPGKSSGLGEVSIYTYDTTTSTCVRLFNVVGMVANGSLGERLADHGKACDFNGDGFSDVPAYAEDIGAGAMTGGILIYGGASTPNPSPTPTLTPTPTPTPPLPKGIALDFRITREGLLNGKVRFDVQDFGPCRFRIYGRRSWNDRTHRGPVRNIFTDQITGDFEFSAANLPRARRAPNGGGYVYHMIGGMNCSGTVLFSNVFARYTNGPLPPVEIRDWEQALNQAMQLGAQSRKPKRKAKAKRRSS